MTEPEHDPELEDFLRRRSPLHRRLSDIDHAEPPAELDRLVLSRARDAIETPAQPPMFRASRWAMPAGLAATILIAFTLVLNVERHDAKVNPSTAAVSAPAAAPAEIAESIALNAAAAQAPAPAARTAPAISADSARSATSSAPTARAAPAPAAAPAAESTSVAHADADTWLREIARLRTAGRTADADRELAAFRRAYPGHSGPSLAKPPTR